MGIVYAAYDRELDRKIALKLLLDAGRGPEAHDRLLREAQALARISHPNVVSVHEVGYHERAIFIAMEYVTGVTLKRWLEDRRRSQAELIDVFTQAGRGLAAVHAAGIVHRDFKPG
ncbi:MAG: protein kinase, partial [Myxococcales bacterium]|nr:protein kinase [Myxococcales bacterium]